MTQLPEPEELREWCKEMVPFTEGFDDMKIGTELNQGDEYLYGLANVDKVVSVEYQYRPTQIKVEIEPGERVNVRTVPGLKLTHGEAWDRATDIQIEEDFVCVTDFVDRDGETCKYDAYWVIEHVEITRFDA